MEYLIKNGSERVSEYASQHTFEMKSLQNFQFTDEKGKDQGINIRQRAKEIIALLGDPNRIKDEREKARINKNKYRGVGSETMSGFDSSPSFNSNNSSNNNNNTNNNYNAFSNSSSPGGADNLTKPASFSSVNTIRSSKDSKPEQGTVFANDLLDFNNDTASTSNNFAAPATNFSAPSNFSTANPFSSNTGGFGNAQPQQGELTYSM